MLQPAKQKKAATDAQLKAKRNKKTNDKEAVKIDKSCAEKVSKKKNKKPPSKRGAGPSELDMEKLLEEFEREAQVEKEKEIEMEENEENEESEDSEAEGSGDEIIL